MKQLTQILFILIFNLSLCAAAEFFDQEDELNAEDTIYYRPLVDVAILSGSAVTLKHLPARIESLIKTELYPLLKKHWQLEKELGEVGSLIHRYKTELLFTDKNAPNAYQGIVLNTDILEKHEVRKVKLLKLYQNSTENINQVRAKLISGEKSLSTKENQRKFKLYKFIEPLAKAGVIIPIIDAGGRSGEKKNDARRNCFRRKENQ